jgi:hypothetical protein
MASKNTLRNKCYSIWIRACYPLSIIPRKKFISKFIIDDLLKGSVGEYYIVRRSGKSFEETFDEYGQVREDAIIETLKGVPGNSMNLLGMSFNSKKHLGYVQNGESGKYWDKKNDKSLWYKHIRKVTFTKNTIPIYYNIRDIQNFKIPYKRKEDSDFKKLIKGLRNPPLVTGGYGACTGICYIAHLPAKLNYWHVEFKIHNGLYPSDGSAPLEVKNVKSDNLTSDQIKDFNNQNWKDQLSFLALSTLLAVKAKRSIENIKLAQVPKSVYIGKG